MNQTIDFNSRLPYYYQLLEILKNNIYEGVWLPGDQIPTEMQLCEDFGISRTVVRQALRELETSNLIVKRKGKGTFVARPKVTQVRVQNFTGFYQELVKLGHKPITKILYQGLASADEKIGKYLNIPAESKVIKIERLRSILDEPIQHVTTFIPIDISPDLMTANLSDRSLYEYLETENGIKLYRGVRYIEAIIASKEEARLFQIKKGDPLIMLNSISYTKAGKAVEYYRTLLRGDRTCFELELLNLNDTD